MICKLTGMTGKGGRILGTTYNNGPAFYVARARTKRRHLVTIAPTFTQQYLVAAAKFWTDSMSTGAKNAWSNWALTTPWDWGLPPNPNINGYAWYMRNSHFVYVQASGDFGSYPGDPSIFGPLLTPSIDAGGYYDSVSQSFNLNVTIPQDYIGLSPAYWGFVRSPPQTPRGIFQYKSVWQLTAGTPPLAGWVTGVSTPYNLQEAPGPGRTPGTNISGQFAIESDNNMSYWLDFTIPVI